MRTIDLIILALLMTNACLELKEEARPQLTGQWKGITMRDVPACVFDNMGRLVADTEQCGLVYVTEEE